MTLAELSETKAILATLLGALTGTLTGATGTAAVDLYYAAGDLTANADALIRSGVWGDQVLAVFNLSVAAGATVAEIEAVRLAMVGEAPATPTASALTAAAIQMALGAEVQILAETTFTSQQAVMAALASLNEAFDGAVEYAADNQAPTVFQALIAAHAAAVRDLTTRAFALPQLITYSFGRIFTSHALAQRLYGDASRCDQLRMLGDVIAPAFMPASGPALSE